MSKLLAQIKTVNDFLSEAMSSVKDAQLVSAFASAAPWWVAATGSALKDSFPLVKFTVTMLDKLLRETPDPNDLGYAACTLAYNRAIEQTMNVVRLDGASKPQKPVKLASMPTTMDMAGFTLKEARGHTFVTQADAVFSSALEALGFNAASRTQLLLMVRARFVTNLRQLLNHPDTSARFQAFKTFAEDGAGQHRAERALEAHAAYQRWLYNEAPVFGEEPFALTHVYAPTHCGKHLWRELRRKNPDKEADRKNQVEEEEPNSSVALAFSEKHSPRVPLLETVMDLLGNPDFNEPIVIQGVAGAGKSSFTLRLASELADLGLNPVRILMRDLDLRLPILDALPKALRYGEQNYDPKETFQGALTDWFKLLSDSSEGVEFGTKKGRIHPSVLILDGWDELTVTATEGFKDDVDRVLTEVRSLFIDSRRSPSDPRIRVIVTGRPSVDIARTRFLSEETPVLTVRPLDPNQLEHFVRGIVTARRFRPLQSGTSTLEVKAAKALPDNKAFTPVFKIYRRDFEQALKEKSARDFSSEATGSLAVLGMPLLANLAVRLMCEIGDAKSMEALVENPTTLYRALVDLTHEHGGQVKQTGIGDASRKYRIHGTPLRQLLWKTAAAMTAIGMEAISKTELRLRMCWSDKTLEKLVAGTTQDNVLSKLIISYFFKTDEEAKGCEFLHKSFREYLFAEGLVEELKEFARDRRVAKAWKRTKSPGFGERQLYWKRFEEQDPRRDFWGKVCGMLGPNWLTPETARHIHHLLIWEIERASCNAGAQKWKGQATESLSLEQWRWIRDALVDLWDYWAEGVHLRPQPSLNPSNLNQDWADPEVMEMVIWSAPKDPAAWSGEQPPPPKRTTQIDAQLGDALFQLNVWIHYHLALADGVTFDSPTGWGEAINLRRYQIGQKVEGKEAVRFAPRGDDNDYFGYFVSRINGAGWRYLGPFPIRLDLRGVYLANTNLVRNVLESSLLGGADLHKANFFQSFAANINLKGANLQTAWLTDAFLIGANLSDADLTGANLSEAKLGRANLRGANLTEADLRGADLNGADLSGADLRGAKYEPDQLKGAITDENTKL